MTGDGDSLADDPSIENEILLLRRVPPAKAKRNSDGTLRIPSDTFRDSRGQCSVDQMLDGGQPERTLQGHDGYGLAAISVGDLREEGFGVIPDPLPDEPNHSLITGCEKRTRRQRLARRAHWLKEPDY